MKVIQSTMSTEHYWKELVYTHVRLDANLKTRHLVASVHAQLEKFEDISRSERETEWAVVQDQAQNHAADERVEDYLRTVHSAVLFLVKQDRKNSLYKDMFPVDFASVLRAKLKDKQEELERMKKVLERGDYNDEFCEAQKLLLDQALIELAEIEERKVVLEEKRFTHKSAVQQWKNETNVVRRGVYGELLQFPESAKEAWTNGFFRVVRKAPKVSALARSKKEVVRVQKKLDVLTQAHDQATSDSVKAELKVTMEEAKAELKAKFKELEKNGGNQADLESIPPEGQGTE